MCSPYSLNPRQHCKQHTELQTRQPFLTLCRNDKIRQNIHFASMNDAFSRAIFHFPDGTESWLIINEHGVQLKFEAKLCGVCVRSLPLRARAGECSPSNGPFSSLQTKMASEQIFVTLLAFDWSLMEGIAFNLFFLSCKLWQIIKSV